MRKPPHRESVLSGLRVQFLQTGICAKERVPLPIRLDPLRPTHGLEIEGELFEAIAVQTEKPEKPTGQQSAIGRVAQRCARIGRNPLLLPKGFESVPVVAEDSVFRTHPDKAHAVLEDLDDPKVGEPFRHSEIAKAVFLRAQHHGRERQHSHCTRISR